MGNEKKIVQLKIGNVYPDPNQPRDKAEKAGKKFRETVKEMGVSIVQIGQQTPIIVRHHPCKSGEYAGREYMIVAGECRWLAHTGNKQLSKTGTIESIIGEFESDGDVYLTQMIENDVRSGLSPMGRIKSWAKGVEHKPIEEVAKALGKTVKQVQDDINILKLPEIAAEAIQAKKLTIPAAHKIFAEFGENATERMIKKIIMSRGTKAQKAAVTVAKNDSVSQKLPGHEDKKSKKKAAKALEKIDKTITSFNKSEWSTAEKLRLVVKSAEDEAVRETVRELRKLATQFEEANNIYRAQSNQRTTDSKTKAA